jgi:hypothetical protein
MPSQMNLNGMKRWWGFSLLVAMGNSFAVAECRAFSPMHDLAYLVTFW